MLNRNITYRTMSGLATILFIALLALLYFNSKAPESPVPKIEPSRLQPELLAERPQLANITWKANSNLKATLEDFKGKVLYINFWAEWCEPCKKEIPFIAQISSEWLTEPFETLLINMDKESKDIENAQNLLDKLGPQLNSLYNQSDVFVNTFSTTAIPTHVLIDKQGRMAMKYVGDILDHQEEFKSKLKRLLQESSASPEN